MYIYVYIYIYTILQACIHIHVYTLCKCIYIYIHTHTHTHIYIYMHINMYLYVHKYTYAYICKHVYICKYTYVCIYVDIFVVPPSSRILRRGFEGMTLRTALLSVSNRCVLGGACGCGAMGLAPQELRELVPAFFSSVDPLCVAHTHERSMSNELGHCNTLQHTATHCNTLQHTATHCNTLQQTDTDMSKELGQMKETHEKRAARTGSRAFFVPVPLLCDTYVHEACQMKSVMFPRIFLARALAVCGTHM